MALSYDKIAYIYSENLKKQCNKLPTMSNRASVIQDLINSYKILSRDNAVVVQSEDASEEELKLFHSSYYIDFLKKVNDCDDIEKYEEEQLEFGLGYDCPILENCFDFARTIAGGSLSAAKLLAAKKSKIVINWFGGWHHSQRDGAEGFCYVNDIVIAIQILTLTFDKILYLDLDIHHGNGVQNAFECSNKILTLSFHKLVPGFYPGSGRLEDVGSHKGKYYSINVPFLEGVNHKTYTYVFDKIFPSIVAAFKPKAFVVQCGADGLNGDQIGRTNLTLKTIGNCVEKVLSYDLPTFFLGGGGYNFANTARLWTYLTSKIIGCDIDHDIPDTSMYFTKYGPTYELHIEESFQKDLNSEEYLKKLISTVLSYCNCINSRHF